MDILHFPTEAERSEQMAEKRREAAGASTGIFGRVFGVGKDQEEIRKIIRQRIKDYRNQKHRMLEDMSQAHVENDYNKPLWKYKEKMYGYGEYNVKYKQEQAERLEEMGDSHAAARARREASQAERYAQKAYDRYEKKYIRNQTQALIKTRKEGIRRDIEQFREMRSNPSAGSGGRRSFISGFFGNSRRTA